jgi:hypothetical protein
MAGKRRYWKEKDGRIWARIAVPKDVQSALGKSELIEPLGGDRRVAERGHAAAVAHLQDQIAAAKKSLETPRPLAARETTLKPISQDDEAKRQTMPTPADVEEAFERMLQRAQREVNLTPVKARSQ